MRCPLKPAPFRLDKAEVTGSSPVSPICRLRGSFVSLLLWEGRSLTFVAEQAGHSVARLVKHYAGVIRELEEHPGSHAEASREAHERVARSKG